MTPEQVRERASAVAGLADALTECERVGLPLVHYREAGPLVLTQRLILGRQQGENVEAVWQVFRTLGGVNAWHLGEPS